MIFTIGQIIKMLLSTLLNVVLINYASRRAMEEGDTDFISGGILMLCMVSCVALLIDSIKRCRQQWSWLNILYLAFCGFNVYYFFKMLVCCVPIAGDML